MIEVGIVSMTLFAAACGQPRIAPAVQQQHAMAKPASQSSQRIADLIQNLRSDAIRHNCGAAIGELWGMGPEVVPALELALESDDLQQRYAACCALSWREGYKPSSRMLSVCVDGLRDDDFPFDGETYTYIFNAARATRFLVHHAQAAEKDLIAAMESDDLQQRFLAAVVLGWSGRSTEAKRIAEVLIPHLRDNDLSCDSILAGGALYRMGRAALPFVQAAAKAPVDIQQAEWISLIALDIQDPPSTDEKMDQRREMHAVDMSADPVVGYQLEGIGIGWNSATEKDRDNCSDPAKSAERRARIAKARNKSLTPAGSSANNRP